MSRGERSAPAFPLPCSKSFSRDERLSISFSFRTWATRIFLLSSSSRAFADGSRSGEFRLSLSSMCRKRARAEKAALGDRARQSSVLCLTVPGVDCLCRRRALERDLWGSYWKYAIFHLGPSVETSDAPQSCQTARRKRLRRYIPLAGNNPGQNRTSRFKVCSSARKFVCAPRRARRHLHCHHRDHVLRGCSFVMYTHPTHALTRSVSKVLSPCR